MVIEQNRKALAVSAVYAKTLLENSAITRYRYKLHGRNSWRL